MSFKHFMTKLGLGLKKHSPEILGVAGTLMIVGGVTWACKASMDVSDKVKETKENVKEIKKSAEDGVVTEDAAKKAVRKEWIECARVCAFAYAGPAVLIGGGIFCKSRAVKIVNKRLDGAIATTALLENRYNTLAENVKKEYGQAEFERLQYGTETRTVEVRKTDPETGIETASMETFENVADINKVGKFTMVFDHNSNRHYDDVVHNIEFLETAERIFTERLQRTGVLWLSDVMKELDIRAKNDYEAKMARMIGWTYDPSDPTKDCVVRLRFRRLYDESSLNYDTGYNPVYILDPNYDMNINQAWFKHTK